MFHLPSCILFDLDGTIVDSLPGIEFSVREAFRICELPLIRKDLRELIGPPIRTILSAAGHIVETDPLDRLERAFRASYDTEGWTRTAPYPGALALLETLHEHGRRLFVVSNKPQHISAQVLEREGMLNYFEAVITRDSRSPEYRGKEEMIDDLVRERGIAREECLMVGDTMEDARAAEKAGVGFIFMRHGYGTPGSSTTTSQMLDNLLQLLALMPKESVL